jgi:sensor histidine kinase YesM
LKTRIIFVSLLAIHAVCAAQQEKIDSLRHRLTLQQEDTSKVKTLIELTRRYFNEAHYVEALPLAQQAIELEEKLGLKEQRAVSMTQIGHIYHYLGNYEKACKSFITALLFWEEHNNYERMIELNQSLSTVYQGQSDYEKQLKSYDQVLKLYEARHNQDGIARTYQDIAAVYIGQCKAALKNLDSAEANSTYRQVIKYHYKALDALAVTRDSITIGNVLTSVGFYLDKSNYCDDVSILQQSKLIAEDNHDLSLKMYDCAMRLFIAKNSKEGEAVVYLYLGRFYTNQGKLATAGNDSSKARTNYQTALANYLKEWTLIKELGYKHGIAVCSLETGAAYTQLNQLLKADSFLTASNTLFREIGYREGIRDSYFQLYLLKTKDRDHQKALAYYQAYTAVKDSMMNEASSKKIIEMTAAYESAKKDRELTLQKAEIAKAQTRKNNILWAAAGFAVIAVLAFIAYRNNRLKNETRLSQQVTEGEMKALRSQMNPHFIFNALNSIRQYINSSPELADRYLVTFSKLMREVLENSEKESVPLEKEISMLRKYMDLESIRLPFGFDQDIIIEPSIDEEMTHVPPLILQPLVENAILHGLSGKDQKGKIVITIAVIQNLLVCSIEDRCTGTKEPESTGEEKRKSMALQIVRQRLEQLSKQKSKHWYLERIPAESGTIVKLGIPV